jgi:predicted HTH transcriptional regulator
MELCHIERMGTGTGDMIKRCREAGLTGPEFTLTDGFVTTVRRKPEGAFRTVGGSTTGQVTPPVTPEVTPEVARLLRACCRPKTRRELQDQLRLKDDDHFRLAYILPALTLDFVEMTIPEKPNSRLQKYRLTAKGRAWIAAQKSRSHHA